MNKKNEYGDKVILNGAVYTVDANDTIASAVAIKDNKIIFVGSEADVKQYICDDTQIIDLKGGIVFPGFIDAHTHPVIGGTIEVFEIALSGITGKEDTLIAIRKFIEENPDLDCYSGLGFLRSDYDEIGPRKEWLDEISPNKPIILSSLDNHSIWLNSAGIKKAGIDKNTIPPEGAIIQKDPLTGEPSGLVQGIQAVKKYTDIVAPVYDKEYYKKAMLYIQEKFNKEGITATCDAEVYLNNPEIYAACEELANEGLLTMRYRNAWCIHPDFGTEKELNEYIDECIELSKKYTTPYFKMHSFKFFTDGIIEESNAALIEPYLNKEADYKGDSVWNMDTLKRLVKKVDSQNFQVHYHQIGDRAAKEMLDILEDVEKENGKRDSRHIAAHVQLISENDKDRMAKLGITALTAPYWAVVDSGCVYDFYIPYLGIDRVNTMFPIKSLMDKNINVAIHSDYYVTDPDMGYLFYSAITRTYPQTVFDNLYGDEYTRTPEELPLTDKYTISALPNMDERLTLKEVLKANTINGAYAHFMDKEVGSIEVSKYADLVIYDKNLFELAVEELPEIKPTMTIFDGKIVYNGDRHL